MSHRLSFLCWRLRTLAVCIVRLAAKFKRPFEAAGEGCKENFKKKLNDGFWRIFVLLWRHMQQIQLTNAYTEHDCVTWGQCNDEGEGKGVRIWSTTADGCGRWTPCHNVTIEIHSAEPIFTILLPFLWPFSQARKIWERWTARFIWYWQEISPVITSNIK